MKQYGFTLIELLVTLAVLAILVAVGVPAMQDTIKRNKVQSILQDFSTSLKFARSEAVRQSGYVTMCASSNQTSCTGTWTQGWIIFKDVDGARDVDSGTDTLLRAHERLDTGHTLTFDYAATASAVTFTARGYTDGQNGTFTLCAPDNEDKDARGIIIQNTGSLRFSVDSDANGIFEDASGTDFSC